MITVIAGLVKGVRISEFWQPVVYQVLPGGRAYVLNFNVGKGLCWRTPHKRYSALLQRIQIDRPFISIAIEVDVASVDIWTAYDGTIFGRNHVLGNVRSFEARRPARKRNANAFMRVRDGAQLLVG